MTTITYTYDETHVTNKDYVILALTDSIDDGGSSYVSVTEYQIDCPYIWDKDCLNNHKNTTYGTKEYKENCIKCKLAWLEREYDTYPHEDGKWEVEDGCINI